MANPYGYLYDYRVPYMHRPSSDKLAYVNFVEQLAVRKSMKASGRKIKLEVKNERDSSSSSTSSRSPSASSSSSSTSSETSSSSSEDNLLVLKSEKGEKLYACSKCSYSTVHKNRILVHNKTHVSLNVYDCHECAFTTNSKTTFKQHKKSHNDETYQCSNCSFACPDKNKFLLHIKSKHSEKRLFRCSDCTYKTFYKQDLVSHKEKHSPSSVKNKKGFFCNMCNFSTNRRIFLMRHKGTMHKKNKR